MGHQLSQLFETFVFIRFGIDLPDLRKHPLGGGHLSGGNIASFEFKRFFRKNRSQIIGFLKCPAINKAIMAAGTFHINSQKYLRNILGKLHVPGLTRIDASPPLDPVDKPGGIRLGIDQLPGHLIIGHISL